MSHASQAGKRLAIAAGLTPVAEVGDGYIDDAVALSWTLTVDALQTLARHEIEVPDDEIWDVLHAEESADTSATAVLWMEHNPKTRAALPSTALTTTQATAVVAAPRLDVARKTASAAGERLLFQPQRKWLLGPGDKFRFNWSAVAAGESLRASILVRRRKL